MPRLSLYVPAPSYKRQSNPGGWEDSEPCASNEDTGEVLDARSILTEKAWYTHHFTADHWRTLHGMMGGDLISKDGITPSGLRIKNGRYRTWVFDASVLGDVNEEDAASSGALTASGISKDMLIGKGGDAIGLIQEAGGYASMPPRFRWIAQRAIYGGPMVVYRSYAESATSYDIRKAYLRAWDYPVPRGDYTAAPKRAQWTDIVDCEGFVTAEVEVGYHVQYPPLPTRHFLEMLTCCPTGRLVGTWPIPYLKWAESEGYVEVVRVVEAALCIDMVRVRFRDAWNSIPYTSNKKPGQPPSAIYQRALGCLSHEGGYSWDGTSFSPEYTLKDQLTRKRGFRPDIFSYGSMRSYMLVHSLMASAPCHSVIAAHVDSVWLDDRCEVPNPKVWSGYSGVSAFEMRRSEESGLVRRIAPDWQFDSKVSESTREHVYIDTGVWAVKGKGECRFFGIGRYDHGGKSARMGGQDGVGDAIGLNCLDWPHGNPTNDSSEYGAYGRAPHWTEKTRPKYDICFPLDWSGWTEKGDANEEPDEIPVRTV